MRILSITIRDIAQHAKVSVATVSRALNHSPSVTEATRMRVYKAAKELGYVPNSVAKSLKTHHTHTIGFLVSDITNADYIAIARTVEDYVRLENYSLILCSTGNNQQQELDYLEMLFSKNIDGLILNTTGFNNEFILKMNSKIPMVLLNRSIPVSMSGFRGDLITTNNYLGSYLLTKHLLELGHSKIFVVRGPLHLNNSIERFQGFVDAMREVGLFVDDTYPYIYVGDYTCQSGINAVQYMQNFKTLPTAILSHCNMHMLGILKALHHHPTLCASDFSLATYDDIPNIDLMEATPTIAHFDTIGIGQQVASSILAHIKDISLPFRKYVFDPTIILGNSCMPPRKNN